MDAQQQYLTRKRREARTARSRTEMLLGPMWDAYEYWDFHRKQVFVDLMTKTRNTSILKMGRGAWGFRLLQSASPKRDTT